MTLQGPRDFGERSDAFEGETSPEHAHSPREVQTGVEPMRAVDRPEVYVESGTPGTSRVLLRSGQVRFINERTVGREGDIDGRRITALRAARARGGTNRSTCGSSPSGPCATGSSPADLPVTLRRRRHGPCPLGRSPKRFIEMFGHTGSLRIRSRAWAGRRGPVRDRGRPPSQPAKPRALATPTRRLRLSTGLVERPGYIAGPSTGDDLTEWETFEGRSTWLSCERGQDVDSRFDERRAEARHAAGRWLIR